ncbi:MAG: hypothetical protein RMI74_00505 [Thermodesulfobacterium sp.]|nr:hypothetical protein [Thermodesulfobacterium sp.]
MWNCRLIIKLKNFFWEKLLLFKFLWLFIFLITGCAKKETDFEKRSSQFLKRAYENRTPSELISNQRDSNQENLISQILPIYKEISPLETKIISLSFKEEKFEKVLHFLAKEAGLNLIILPEVYNFLPLEAQKLTFQFKNQPLKNILESILETLNLHYEIKKGVLYITPFEERIFSLEFLHLLQGSEFRLGGDVLGGEGVVGGGGAGTTGGTPTVIYSPLKGKYEIKGELEKKQVDAYTQLEESIKNLISKNGIYTLNRLTGNLYVKDHPSHIRMISKFIENFKSRYKKQILVEAKIVEVELSQEHDMGIDWLEIANYPLGQNMIRLNELASTFTTRTTEPTIALTISGRPSINLIIHLLRQYGTLNLLSNPRLRVIHGQPALISVGRSIEFIKDITRSFYYGAQVTQVFITVTTSSIFDGILLGITPYISEEGEIVLHIVPIKSDLISLRREEIQQTTTITLPEVNLRELTSVIKLKPKDTIILGGLILEKETLNQRKIAGLEEIPVLGNLFKREKKGFQKTELVIIITVDLV